MTETVAPIQWVCTIRHDGGRFHLTVNARNEDAAKRTVMDVEGCPERSIEYVRPVPLVGMPATIHYVTDSSAAVVVKVNPKSVLIARVEIGEWTQDMRVDGARDPNCPPVMVAEGITNKVIGEPHRYKRLPNGRIADGSIGVTLGRSISRRDYRD